MMSDHRQKLEDVERYYTSKLREHGPTAQGMDWRSEESQILRFEQLGLLWRAESSFSVNDVGCGYGALARWLATRRTGGTYVGYDISPTMVDAAREHTADLPACQFTTSIDAVPVADYTVASGIFNVRLDHTVETWREYVLAVIDAMAAKSTKGFGFNALTSFSDSDKQRPDLYYADPLELFDHCERRFSRFVSLIHDYPLYEFTILIRLR